MMDSTSDILETPMVHKPFQGFRKVFHVLAASSAPLFYLYPPFRLTYSTARNWLLIAVAVSFVASFSLDYFRLRDKQFNSVFMKSFSALIRHTEENQFNGSTFICFAFFMVILVFSRKIAITAMFFLSLGDAAAELGGKYFGRLKIFQKSWEGAFFFFIVAFVTAFALLEDWRIAVVGALAGAAVELFSLEVDDNLTVPIGSALALWLALILFHMV